MLRVQHCSDTSLQSYRVFNDCLTKQSGNSRTLHHFTHECKLVDLHALKLKSSYYSIKFDTNRFRSKYINSGKSSFSQTGGGEVANPKGSANLLFGQIFSKTAWKWRKFDRSRGGTSKFLVDLCRSAIDKYNNSFLIVSKVSLNSSKIHT